MGIPSQNELITQKHTRLHFQPSGAGPVNKRLYAGQDMAYIQLSGISQSQIGGVKGQFIHDPNRIGQYKIAATMISAPDLAKGDMTIAERRGGIPRQFLNVGCQFNLYEAVGQCRDLSDFNGGWSDYVMVYPAAIITDKDFGDRATWEDDKPLETKLSLTFARRIYPVGPIAFGAVGPTLTGKVARDVTYATSTLCGDCGTENDGTQWIYACGEGAAAVKPDFHYSTDGGATWTTVNVASAANDEDLIAIAVVGTRVVALSKTAGGATSGGYYYWDINPITGAPTSTTPTKVTTGFVNNSAPNDIFVVSPTEIYFVGDAGYIYKSTDITAGVAVVSAGIATTSNLLRIDGNNEILVATGASGAALKSTNRGLSWSATTTNPGAASVQALSVVSKNVWYVGDSTGAVYYTNNGGESWATKVVDSSLTAITDILFATPEAGFIAGSTVTPTARIYATIDGGYSWTRNNPRVSGVPTFTKASRLAVPTGADVALMANTLAVAGTGAVATDGIMLLGTTGIS